MLCDFADVFCRVYVGQQCSLLPTLELTKGNNVPCRPHWNLQRATMFLTALIGTYRGQQCSLLPSVEITEGNNVPYCPPWNSQSATMFLTALIEAHGRQQCSLLSSLELTECNNVPYCPLWKTCLRKVLSRAFRVIRDSKPSSDHPFATIYLFPSYPIPPLALGSVPVFVHLGQGHLR